MKIKSKPFIRLLSLAVAISFIFGVDAGALTLDKEGNYQLGGFIQNQTGIRLEDGVNEAGDFSMFRNELFMDFSARISDEFQFKAIARGHYEGVYGLDSDVNQLPKNERTVPGPHALDMESDVDFREYYMTYHTGDFVFKLGRQQVAWGEADAINIADIVCPLDLSWRWSFPAWEEIRIPLHMLNAFYIVPNSPHEFKFELVYVPADFRPHNFGYPGSNWSLYSNFSGNNTVPDFIGEEIFRQMDEGLPDNDLSNPQGGVRLHALLGAWDTFWFVYYGRDKVGVQTAARNPAPDNFLGLRVEYPPVTTMGMTFNVYCPWLETVFRGEMAYAIDAPFSPAATGTNVVDPFKYGKYDTAEVMIGFDYNAMIPFLNPTKSFFFSGQVDNKFVFDIDEDEYRTFFGHNDRKDHRLVCSLLVNTEYYEGKIVPQVLGVTFVNEQSGFFDANITYKPTFILSFALGYLGIWGDTEQAGLFFGPVKNNDEIYAKLKWSF